MSLALIVAVVGGVLAGVVAGLKIIAPLTKTDKDDKALAYAEKAEAVVEGVQPYVGSPAAPAAPASAAK